MTVLSVTRSGDKARTRYRIKWQGGSGSLTEARTAAGLGRRTVEWRIKYGWTVRQALETPTGEPRR